MVATYFAVPGLARLRSSSPPADRGAPSPLHVPQRGQCLLDPPYARLGLLCALDSAHVFAFATVGQAIKRGAGDWIGAEGAGEVRGLGHDTRLGIKFQPDLNLVAGRHTGGLPVGDAQAKQVAATHDRDSAPPRMPIDRDRDPWPLALTKRLHNLRRHFQPPHRLRRLDISSELHDPPLGSLLAPKTNRRHLKGQMRENRRTYGDGAARTGSRARRALASRIASDASSPGIVSSSSAGPPVGRDRKRLLSGFLGEVEVAEEAAQAGEDTAHSSRKTWSRIYCSFSGRTSTAPPMRAAGMREASSIAASRSSAS